MYDLEQLLEQLRSKGFIVDVKKNRVAVLFGDGCYAEVPVYKGTIKETPGFVLELIRDGKVGTEGTVRIFNDTKRGLCSAMTAESVVETWEVFLWRRDKLYGVEFVDDYDYYIPFGFRVTDTETDETYDFPFAEAIREADLFSLSDYFNGTALNLVIDKIKALNYEQKKNLDPSHFLRRTVRG